MSNIRNRRWYIEHCLKIRNKRGQMIPFRLNAPQQKLYAAMKRQHDAGMPILLIVLKARQMGFSTVVGGTMFAGCSTEFNQLGLIVAHKDDATRELFGMHKRFLDHLPPEVKPQVAASNGYEIVFDKPAKSKSTAPGLGSRIKIATAGGSGVGRGSTVQKLHMSEFAFWPGDPRENYIGLMQTVPMAPGSMVIIESTANGFNFYKELWDQAVEREKRGELDGFLPVFFAWWEMEEYRRPVAKGFARTDEEEALAQRYGLDDEQLAWRRWCIATNCGGDIDKFHQEYPACPEEAFLATGSCVFDQQILIGRIEQVRKLKPEVGEFRIEHEKGSELRIVGYQWREDRQGLIRIYKRPEAGVPYVIGADTAGSDGRDKASDYFGAHVLDNRTGEQVAVLHGKPGERAFTEQIYALGKFYNNALVGIETNYSTYPNELLQLMGYNRLYVQQAVDDYTKTVRKKYGFRTDRVTRPLIIDGLKDVAQYHPELIADADTLREMLVFIRNAAGRPEAEVGQHDDLVMSLAISHFIRGQQRTAVRTEEPTRTRKWTKQMIADYNRASPEERREMQRRWGPRR